LEYGEDALRIILRDMTAKQQFLPEPGTLGEVKSQVREFRALDGLTTPENTIYQFFPVPDLDYTPVKVTISLPKATLAEVDKKAALSGMTRSGFLAKAAARYEVG
jgi:hypothetical protein